MRLSDVLSKPINSDFKQIETIVNKNVLEKGEMIKTTIGKIGLNYYCKNCKDMRTFNSESQAILNIINNKLAIVNSLLFCSICESWLNVSFLIEFQNEININSPNVKIKKIYEMPNGNYKSDAFNFLFNKADLAYNLDLGSGSIIYLRKIFELIVREIASINGISLLNKNDKRKTFKDLLNEVENKCKIIPIEFTENKYKLFSDLSNIIHGEFDEDLAIKKYPDFKRLIIGILDNIKNKKELSKSLTNLGWNEEGVA